MTQTKSFFEGWYFKHQTTQTTVALIPSQTIDSKGNKKPSIQIITNNHLLFDLTNDYTSYEIV
jgi:hypothetical protein